VQVTEPLDGMECTNWSQFVGSGTQQSKMLVQWCHGAPGVIATLADAIAPDDSPVLHQFFVQAGELIWLAGASRKGANICHGTAGSGMAMLKLYAHTGDRSWLDRARQFALHAIEQYRQELAEVGHARFSLWTGDLGLALFLRDVLREKAQMPGLDFV
jgi:lantibiotic modifying enzyme